MPAIHILCAGTQPLHDEPSWSEGGRIYTLEKDKSTTKDLGCEVSVSRSDRKTKKRQNSRSKQRIHCHVVLRRIKTCQS